MSTFSLPARWSQHQTSGQLREAAVIAGADRRARKREPLSPSGLSGRLCSMHAEAAADHPPEQSCRAIER